MSNHLNELTLLGRLTADPHQYESTDFVQLPLVLISKWFDREQEHLQSRQDKVTVYVEGRVAYNCMKALEKGSLVAIRGQLVTSDPRLPLGLSVVGFRVSFLISKRDRIQRESFEQEIRDLKNRLAYYETSEEEELEEVFLDEKESDEY